MASVLPESTIVVVVPLPLNAVDVKHADLPPHAAHDRVEVPASVRHWCLVNLRIV